MELGKTLTDKLKSKIGLGNNGKLMSRGKKKAKKSGKGQREVSELRKKLREKWYSRMGLIYGKETID